MTIELRPAEDADQPAILELAAISLGWAADQRHAALYRWKHLESPFGPSPTWVALDGSRLVGLRAFMRWEFLRSGEVVRAVRAVDTATHPDYRGRGVFRRLTLTAVDALREQGVAFVFNTPNAQSLPGYLSMGWARLGRVPVQARLSSPAALQRVARARVPAVVWPEPAPGEPVPALAARIDPGSSRLATRRTGEFFAWRYGNPLLGYRAATSGGATALYRVRTRGPATEAVVCDVVGDHPSRSTALLEAARMSGADYALWTGPAAWRHGFVPLPRQGPLVLWRALADTTPPARGHFDFRLGDLELL